MKASNKHKRLAARIADHAATMNVYSKETKVQQRKESGGYHKPGSNNK